MSRLIDADKFEAYSANGTDLEGEEFLAYLSGMQRVLEDIDAAPTIDSESLRDHAAWINIHDGNFICSCCKNPVNIVDMMNHPLMIGYLYCPHCGAKMDGGKQP